jgi:hypothetical protein
LNFKNTIKKFKYHISYFKIMYIFALTILADMVKLVDMPDLGSGAARRVGSSPIIRTTIQSYLFVNQVNRIFYFYLFP